MKSLIKLVFTIVLYFGLHIRSTFSQGSCQPSTYFDVPGAQPWSNVSSVVTSSNCQTACLDNTSCYGFTQGNGNCILNVGNPNGIDYSSSNVYSAIIRGTSNCNAAQSCLSTWQATKNRNGQNGQQISMATINDCVKWCQTNDSCTAFDWDTLQMTCWTFSSTSVNTGPSPGVYHYIKNCAPLPTTGPTTPNTLSSMSLTSSATKPSSSSTKPNPSSTKVSTVVPNGTSMQPTPLLSSQKAVSPGSSVSVSVSAVTSQPPAITSSSTASPCNQTCINGKECNRTTATCVCPTICTTIYRPVCGSDNKTYDNYCIFGLQNCLNNSNATIISPTNCGAVSGGSGGDEDEDGGWYPMAIKPAYIVLAGIGGGCLLLVLTAVIVLCVYPMNGGETYSKTGTLSVAQTNGHHHGEAAKEQIQMESEDGENVEFNPYYNRSEIDAPDFTKEENIM